LIHAYFFSSLTNANWGGIIHPSKCGETIHGAFLSSSFFFPRFRFFSLFFYWFYFLNIELIKNFTL
jgi:hypothetical protein